MNKIIYISGKITGDENYVKKFAEAERILTEKGFKVINPCKIGEYEFFSYEQFLHIDFALIDCCDALFMPLVVLFQSHITASYGSIGPTVP